MKLLKIHPKGNSSTSPCESVLNSSCAFSLLPSKSRSFIVRCIDVKAGVHKKIKMYLAMTRDHEHLLTKLYIDDDPCDLHCTFKETADNATHEYRWRAPYRNHSISKSGKYTICVMLVSSTIRCFRVSIALRFHFL